MNMPDAHSLFSPLRGQIRPSLVGLAAWLAFNASAIAQADPTQPPPAWMPPGAVIQGADAQTDAAQVAILRGQKRSAVVGGVLVQPGDEFKGGKVIAINDRGVLIEREGRREMLSLTPGVQKTRPQPVKTHSSQASKE